ncbi:IS3 family transposase [Salmonella enterica subsp. enterica]|nr:IS3 family transposase [Salmonella enterica subsp. enterica]EDW9585744.1 IS3 family transposase [Salmonella enterica subsp. enterica]EED9672490.1 IS3 family transposase [Salmonella enterica subsp. enterica]EIO7469107.1 IS3 family transposase [Salmonella enterica subsp. enterica]EIY5766289.1 IS3 family transposase [Salmonella enterica subsp. enterica]
MFTEAERLRAIELYFKYGRKLAPVVRELGYPSKRNLRRWIRLWEASDGATKAIRRKPRYSDMQKQAAVEHYLNHDCCLAFTSRTLSYPCCGVLARWVNERHPDRRLIFTSTNNQIAPFEPEVKRQAVMELCTRHVPAREIARNIGISRTVLYKWKDEIIGDEAYQSMRKHEKPSLTEERDALREEVNRLNQEIRRQQMELDILKKAEEIIKKDPGISVSTLTNREKTQIADVLRGSYPLKELLQILVLVRSSFFYHRAALRSGDKYATIRIAMTEIFNDNYRCYGYRRLHAMLRHKGQRLSEKVVRRLMVEEQLVVSRNRRRHYSSYCGEIGPAPDNLLARDFNAEQPNQKWLTDITEFQLPSGKVWLSPVVDYFDGKVVSWSLGTRPDAELANTMLEGAISTLTAGEQPIIHNDRGGHYRWPGWLERVNAAGLIRSMSRKGCSPDNAACEGFFGRLKTEMYYGREWSGVTLENFMLHVDTYIRWYNEHRIKLSLGALSPEVYRRQLGLAQ